MDDIVFVDDLVLVDDVLLADDIVLVDDVVLVNDIVSNKLAIQQKNTEYKQLLMNLLYDNSNRAS